MPTMRPDPTFYPSAKQAAEAPAEELAYLAMLSPNRSRPDAIGVVDVKPGSKSYGRLIGQVDMPNRGDELHHFGWNACSASLCPWAPHPHVERRYLVVPGINSSRIHILDTKSNPRQPEMVKVIEPDTLARKTGYAAPHTVHCGPDGIYLSALGEPPRATAPVASSSWITRASSPRESGRRTAVLSSWATTSPGIWVMTPPLPVNGAPPAWYGKVSCPSSCWEGSTATRCMSGTCGRVIIRRRIHLGDQYQMTLELRPARDPRKAYGFVGVVISLEDLSASVWLWYREGGTEGHGVASEKGNGRGGKSGKGGSGKDAETAATASSASSASSATSSWKVKKVISIPAEPADPADLPPLLQGFKAVAPLITDINLSLDDRQLYVSCWGTGEVRQYDVSDPFNPKLTATTQIGGIVRRAAHPANPGKRLNGGPQMVELSRDGRRVYLTNGLYSPWDDQFYPAGLESWMVKFDTKPEGGMALDPKFYLDMERGVRCHQVRLQGGDASSDSFCFS